MQIPLQITFRGLTPSEALQSRIRAKAAKLEKFTGHITRCRVAVEDKGRHQRRGRQFGVRITVRLPQHDIVVSRLHDEDVYIALREAFDAAVRRVEETARVQRGDVKSKPSSGRV
jgi:ribosomal subunit interface protein